MTDEAWLDTAVFRCPSCGRFYVDASWYAVTLESEIECGVCHSTFIPKKELVDRVLLKFTLDKKGIIQKVTVKKHFQNKPQYDPSSLGIFGAYLDPNSIIYGRGARRVKSRDPHSLKASNRS